MVRRPKSRRLTVLLAVLLPVAAAIAMQPGVSSADVTAVKGQAYGVAGDLTLFGGPQHKDPTPLVTLPPGGTVTAASLLLNFGPATFLRAGTTTVSSTGSTGPTGSVTSTADFGPTTDNGNTPCPNNPSTFYSGAVTAGSTTVTSPYINFTSADIGKVLNGTGIPAGATIVSVQSPTQATISAPATSSSDAPDFNISRGTGPGTCIYNSQFTADTAHVTCTANESGVSGSTTFKNGLLATATDINQDPTVQGPIPDNPAPNTTIDGSFELGASDHESFTYIFNEQILNADGSLTVNATHLIPHGQTAVGSPPTPANPNFVNGVIFGSVTCGVTAVASTSSTSSSTSSSSSTSTTAPTTTTTAPTTTTTAPTTTTTAPTTTTTAPTTTTTAPTTTTTAPTTTTTAPTTTTTTAPTTTTTAPTTTTTAPTTTTTAPTTTTTAPTTTTTAPTTTTTAPSTTTTTAPSTTTTVAPGTTTTAPPGNPCAQLRAARVTLNGQIDALRVAVIQAGFSPSQQATILAQLEAARTQANTQIDQALAAAACPPPQT
jgi:hypothetical protein